MSEPLISLRNLTKTFETESGTVHAVTDVSFDIARGSIAGLVGESGSGKTTLGRSILRLIEPTSGQALFDGVDLVGLDQKALRDMRRRMQIIFQDPVSSLNPRMKVAEIVGEGLRAHKLVSPGQRRDRIAALLEEVGLEADHMRRYPHEFSGGQRQRIGVARALALEPEFIVADESVSALDVSVQAQILNLLLDLRAQHNLTLLFIAHDLSVVEYLCDQIVVMYLGRVVEYGPARALYQAPSHPYSKALISAVPQPDPTAVHKRDILSGDIPSPLAPPSGCVFRTRCPYAADICARSVPEPVTVTPGHVSLCSRLEEIS